MLDAGIGGAFFYVAYFGPEWLEGIFAGLFGLVFSIAILLFGAIAFHTWVAQTVTTDKELDAKVAEQADAMWTDKLVTTFSRSTSFTHYHIATTTLFMTMFVNTGHYFIAVLKVAGTLISLYLIQMANKIYLYRKYNTIQQEL